MNDRAPTSGNRLRRTFADLESRGRRALVAYLCVGDPDEAESVELALACAEAGADVLELGCPFSDPTADGPAIARAGQRALAKGGGLAATLRVARAVRARSSVPIVLFGYYNPLFVRSEAASVRDAAEAGVDALLVVDLPIDEADDLRALAEERGLGVVPLVAPTTAPERIQALAKVAETSFVPFVYYVSMTGVTGGSGDADVLGEASDRAAEVRAATGRPTVVGFGIDSPDRARTAAKNSDGVVVGSAIVRKIEDHESLAERVEAVRELVRSLREAI